MLTSILSFYIAANFAGEINTTVSPQLASTNLETQATQQQKRPVKDPQYISPVVSAKGVVIFDMETEESLYGKNTHTRMQIASITKLMTILIILEENKMEEVVTVSNNAASTGGSTMHLRTGEKITVKNLLYGALIHSANDAAVALAEHNAGSVNKFVEKMNKKTKELNLINTSFQNPVGFDSHQNFSSPHDIAKLSKTVYQNDFVKEAAQIKSLTVRSINGTHTHRLENTNSLLNNEHFNIKGLKTGRTSAAGLCLTSIAKNTEGNKIITIVLDSPSRFQESKVLIDWAFRAYQWH